MLVSELLAQAGEGGSHAGEAVLFWLLAPVSVVAALGLVVARKAVHGALMLAVVMLSLAVFYIALEAPFLGVVQVIVYTGAIMMLFLFVIMLVGVDASDSRVEILRGQRVAGVLAGLGLGVLLVSATGRAVVPDPVGVSGATPDGYVAAIADLIFSRYVWTFEVTAVLLIIAALGAMVFTHRERLFRRVTQRELSERRFREGGLAASPRPNPGIYARYNAVDTPGLLPDGSPSEESVPQVLSIQGVVRTSEEDARHVARLEQQVDELTGTEAPQEGEEK